MKSIKNMDGFQKKYRLDNSFALITGGAGLLGVEHAKALLEIGAHVVIADLSEENIEKIKDPFKGYKCSFE